MEKTVKKIMIIAIAIFVFASALPNRAVSASSPVKPEVMEEVKQEADQELRALSKGAASNETDIKYFVFGGTDKGIITDYVAAPDAPPKDVVIPKSYVNGSGDTIQITGIGEMAFSNFTTVISSIKLNDNLKTIGDKAFTNTNSLTSIVIPDSVEKIGASAFEFCLGLESVTLGDGLTSIQDKTFSSSGLKSVTIPDGVTSIENSAFFQCDRLKSVTIGSGVRSMGDGVFSLCSQLTSVTIPDEVTAMGTNIFNGCSELTSISIPGSVTIVGAFTFRNCSRLTSVTIGSGVTSLSEGMFSSCSALTSLSMGDRVTNIESAAFYKCSGLTSITIPDSVTRIGSNAFNGCSGLTSITIPKKLKIIDRDVFIGTNIKTFKLPKSIEVIGSSLNGAFDATTETILIDMRKDEAPISLTQNKPWGAVKADIYFSDDIVNVTYDVENKGYERIITYTVKAIDVQLGLIQEVTLPDGNVIPVSDKDTYVGNYTINNNGTFDFSVLTKSGMAATFPLTINDIGNIDLQVNDFSISKSRLDKIATIADLFTVGGVKAIDVDKGKEIAVASNNTLAQIKAALINDKDTLTITLTSTNAFKSETKDIKISIDNSLSHSIKFMNGSILLREENVDTGEVVKTWSPKSEVAGMVFDDWYSDEQLSVKFDFNTKITKDEVLYAKWKNCFYTINYDTGFSDLIIHSKNNIKWNDNDLIPSDPIKKGYTFKKWISKDTDTVVTKDTVFKDISLIDKDGTEITLTAEWKKNEYTIKYDSGSTQIADKTGVTIDDTNYLPTPPTKKGYTFEGWKVGSKVVDGSKAFGELIGNEVDGSTFTFVGIWKEIEPVKPDVPVTPEKPTEPDKGDNGSTGSGSDNKNPRETPKDDGSIEENGEIVRPGDDGKKPVRNPDGEITIPKGGSVEVNGNKYIFKDGGLLLKDGTMKVKHSSTVIIKGVSVYFKYGGIINPDGTYTMFEDDSKKTTYNDKDKEEVKSGFKLQDSILPIWIILYAGGYLIIRSKKED